MRLNSIEPDPQIRFFLSWFEFFWRWSFRLLSIGLVLILYFNWYQLSIRLMLAPPNSLARHFSWLLAALLLLQFFVSFIHELGHLLAGHLVKLQLHLFGIGPFSFWRDGGRRVFRLRRGLGIFNGVAASIPLSDKNLVRRMLVFAMGGPMLSLILAFAAGFLFWGIVQQPEVYRRAAWVWDCFAITAVLSFVTFLSTMRPGAYSNGYPTDGGRIAILLRGGNRVKSWCAQLMLNAADVNKLRPRLWDPTFVQQAALPQKKSLDSLMGHLTAYYWALDNQKIELAERYLKEALEARFFVSGGSRIKVQLESAYFFARFKKDLDEAEKWLAFLGRPPGNLRPAYFRALTAVAQLKADHAAVETNYTLGIEAYQKVDHKTGLWQAEMAWLKQMNVE